MNIPDVLRLRDLQRFHRELDERKGFDRDLLRNVALLCGEIGELVRAIQNARRPASASAAARAETQIGEELADLLAYVIKIANLSDVELEDAYRRKMQRNLERDWPDFKSPE